MKIIFPVFLVLAYSSLFSQVQKPDTEKLKLTGNIKTIYENLFEIVEDSGLLKKGPLSGIIQLNFNPDGYLTEQLVSNKDWELVYKIVFLYEEKNRLVKKEMFGAKDGSFTQTVFRYDPKLNSVRETQSILDGTVVSKTVTRYDSSGNIIQQTVSNLLNKNNSYVVNCVYDPGGNLVEITSNEGSGRLFRETYEYDSSGLVMKTNYFKNGEFQMFVEYKYVMDKMLNWIKEYEIPSVANWNQSFFRERNITYY